VFEYIGTLLNDQKFGVIIDDGYFEVPNGDLFTLYYGIGAAYLNVKGIQNMEKAAKVQTYS